MADGASNNVVALLQGKSVPPNDEEIFEGAKSRCELVEKEMQRQMTTHDTVQEDLEVLLGFLMDVKENHPSAMYSSGIDPERCSDLETLMDQVRIGCLVFDWNECMGLVLVGICSWDKGDESLCLLVSCWGNSDIISCALLLFARLIHTGANCRGRGTKIHRRG